MKQPELVSLEVTPRRVTSFHLTVGVFPARRIFAG